MEIIFLYSFGLGFKSYPYRRLYFIAFKDIPELIWYRWVSKMGQYKMKQRKIKNKFLSLLLRCKFLIVYICVEIYNVERYMTEIIFCWPILQGLSLVHPWCHKFSFRLKLLIICVWSPDIYVVPILFYKLSYLIL